VEVVTCYFLILILELELVAFYGVDDDGDVDLNRKMPALELDQAVFEDFSLGLW